MTKLKYLIVSSLFCFNLLTGSYKFLTLCLDEKFLTRFFFVLTTFINLFSCFYGVSLEKILISLLAKSVWHLIQYTQSLYLAWYSLTVLSHAFVSLQCAWSYWKYLIWRRRITIPFSNDLMRCIKSSIHIKRRYPKMLKSQTKRQKWSTHNCSTINAILSLKQVLQCFLVVLLTF